mmetsp:Transcript_21084/g.23436  ORF Transcript_21084/g.23436 Transcript_21084/m.23436 type:complete len:89 (-) Transcript_21084:114-380(-)
MFVTIDTTRVVHLIFLTSLTYFGGNFLVKQFEWNSLSAYSFSGTIVVQINNAIRMLLYPLDDHKEDLSTKKDEFSIMHRRKNKNPKKN